MKVWVSGIPGKSVDTRHAFFAHVATDGAWKGLPP